MKTLNLSALAAALLLSACAGNKAAEATMPKISVEEAISQCKQSGGDQQDRAVFDACMKDKGFLRTNAQPAAPAAEAAPAS